MKVLVTHAPVLDPNDPAVGYCATDMSSWRGTKTAAAGADTPVWAALLPPDTPSGQFFSERTPEPF
jgi:hypothetical protein